MQSHQLAGASGELDLRVLRRAAAVPLPELFRAVALVPLEPVLRDAVERRWLDSPDPAVCADAFDRELVPALRARAGLASPADALAEAPFAFFARELDLRAVADAVLLPELDVPVVLRLDPLFFGVVRNGMVAATTAPASIAAPAPIAFLGLSRAVSVIQRKMDRASLSSSSSG